MRRLRAHAAGAGGCCRLLPAMLAVQRTGAMLAVALSLSLAGCGPFGGESDSDQASDALTELIEARNQGDFATVCSLISAQQLAKFTRAGTTCEKALPRLAKEGTTTTIRIDEVRVSGERATVDATVSQTGGAGNAQTILLLKEDGDWKVSKVGF
jgi:hypothetical protein